MDNDVCNLWISGPWPAFTGVEQPFRYPQAVDESNLAVRRRPGRSEDTGGVEFTADWTKPPVTREPDTVTVRPTDARRRGTGREGTS
ncbi:hypothetical protein GCM10023223_36960 [Stackebrandtia albiflava]